MTSVKSTGSSLPGVSLWFSQLEIGNSLCRLTKEPEITSANV